jgi:hypothetical protein
MAEQTGISWADGVKRAGHMLDGVAWQQFPASPAAHSFNKEPEHV